MHFPSARNSAFFLSSFFFFVLRQASQFLCLYSTSKCFWHLEQRAITRAKAYSCIFTQSHKYQQTDRPTDRQTDRPTDRQTNRPTDRQTDRQTNRQTDKQTNRQTDKQTDKQTNIDNVGQQLGSEDQNNKFASEGHTCGRTCYV